VADPTPVSLSRLRRWIRNGVVTDKFMSHDINLPITTPFLIHLSFTPGPHNWYSMNKKMFLSDYCKKNLIKTLKFVFGSRFYWIFTP